jgi:hypothetical protein
MNAILLTLFVSLGVVVLALLGFGFSFRQRDLEHADRLSLLPLEDDELAERVAPRSSTSPAPKPTASTKETDR